MMLEVKKIIEAIEQFAPLESAAQWDNSGWQINLGNEYAEKVMLALSLSPQVLSQALEQKCDLIITHHPLIFSPIKNIGYQTINQQILVDCVKNNIQVYSAHTNLDVAKGGVNDILAEKLGLSPVETIDDFVKIASYYDAITLDDFILKLKIALNCTKLKVINPNNIQQIKSVAVCGGAGGDFVTKLSGVDVFVTGDVKYHSALDVKNMIVIDAGHFETERIVLNTLRSLLSPITSKIVIAKEADPWQFV